MEEASGLLELVIAKTRRVPLPAGPAGEGSAAARQLDAALLAAGWKLSAGLLLALSGLDAAVVLDLGVRVLAVSRREAGDHVRHNAYFRDFPRNVPATMEFWLRCIREALAAPETAGRVAVQLAAGSVNLLDLPAYGTYQHTWEELIAAHGALIPAASDRLTVLHEGGGLADEARALYLALASGSVPLSDDDTAALATLALACAAGPQPEATSSASELSKKRRWS